jgi:phenylpropionate dioxygenase-like ring-hydroxylating dioxygenase large terminal subunit
VKVSFGARAEALAAAVDGCNYPAANLLGKWHYGQAVACERLRSGSTCYGTIWYIACASSRLGAAPRAFRVFDANLVLFRDSAGVVAALRDRCCHRGVKLSLGQVVDDNLACGYHGWRDDGKGQCVHIPSLTAGQAIPGRARVDSFRCHEQQGYVWVWMGDPAKMRGPPPQIASFSEKRWWQGSVPMQCPALMGIENNLDWYHPYFAHPWRTRDFRDRAEQVSDENTRARLLSAAAIYERESDLIESKKGPRQVLTARVVIAA